MIFVVDIFCFTLQHVVMQVLVNKNAKVTMTAILEWTVLNIDASGNRSGMAVLAIKNDANTTTTVSIIWSATMVSVKQEDIMRVLTNTTVVETTSIVWKTWSATVVPVSIVV